MKVILLFAVAHTAYYVGIIEPSLGITMKRENKMNRVRSESFIFRRIQDVLLLILSQLKLNALMSKLIITVKIVVKLQV